MTSNPHTRTRPGKFLRNVSVTLAGNIALPLSTIIVAPLLARGLGVDGRGEVAAAIAPTALAVAVAALGLPEAVIYFVSKYGPRGRTVLRGALILSAASGVASTALVMVLAPVLSGGDSDVEILIRGIAISLMPTLLVGIGRGLASGEERWRLVAAERLITGIARVFGVLVLLLSGWLTPLSAAVVLAVAPIVGGLPYVALIMPARTIAGEPVSMKNTAKYGARVWVGAVSGLLLARIDQVLLTPLGGTFELGLYAVAVNISEVPLVLTSALTAVLFASDARNNDDEALGRSSRLAFVIAMTLAALACLTMHLWLPAVFGSEFAPALAPSVILFVAVALGTPGSFAGVALVARGRPGLRSVSLVVACVVNIACIVILAPSLGAVGAAIATLVGNLIAAGLNLVFAWRILGISPVTFIRPQGADIAATWAVVRRRRND
ncbi:oligosaccharide flippase family protein [Agromyces sp. NPDC049794]|uniref:oligosaccharide flippase family protein n=1 Tax=unclassified Agromyces TaxID=2639701 RepID=UPI0033EF657A